MKKRIILISGLSIVLIMLIALGLFLINPPVPEADVVIDLTIDHNNRCISVENING